MSTTFIVTDENNCQIGTYYNSLKEAEDFLLQLLGNEYAERHENYYIEESDS